MKPTFLTSDVLVGLLVPLAVGLAIFYGYLYRQEAKMAKQLTRRQRWLLRALRMGVALLVILALAKPAVSMVRHEERLPVIPLLLDDSASMGFPDARENPLVESSPPNRRSRFDTARTIAQRLQERLTLSHRVVIYGCSDQLKTIRTLPHRPSEKTKAMEAEELFPETQPPTGEYSNIGESLNDSLRELAGDKISGIVLLSDGRETGGNPRMNDVASLASNAGVPVHTFAFGSEHPLRDLRIDEVIFPAEASLGDVLTFHVKVTNQISDNLSTELTLQEEGKKLPTTKRMALKRGQSMVSIGAIPETEGEREFKLFFPKFPDEVNTENNEQVVHVKIVKRTLRALLIAAEATREYLYLVPALLRDPVIDISCYLQSRDEDYIQQGNTNIERLPATTADWKKYDVAILYDVNPNGITNQQLGGLEDMVNTGGGLLIIAGTNHGLAKLIQVHAAKVRGLLPVEIDRNLLPDWEKIYDKPFALERTPAGKGHPIMLGSTNEKLNEHIWSFFPKFNWCHPVQSVKPKAITLLKQKDEKGSGSCVMAVHRYGEGAVFFSAINGLWRWRFPGESYDYDRFWTRAIRYLGETRLHGAQQQVALDTDRRTYAPGEEVQINLRILDPALMSQLSGQQLYVSVTSTKKDEQMVPLRPEPDGSPIYRGFHRARQVGSMLVKARQAAPGGSSADKPLYEVKHSFMVKMESLEGRDTSANLEGMQDLAERTEGKWYNYHNMKDFEDLFEAIPKDPQVISEQILLEVWDGTVFLLLFLVLACAEWSLRKWWGLL